MDYLNFLTFLCVTACCVSALEFPLPEQDLSSILSTYDPIKSPVDFLFDTNKYIGSSDLITGDLEINDVELGGFGTTKLKLAMVVNDVSGQPEMVKILLKIDKIYLKTNYGANMKLLDLVNFGYKGLFEVSFEPFEMPLEIGIVIIKDTRPIQITYNAHLPVEQMNIKLTGLFGDDGMSQTIGNVLNYLLKNVYNASLEKPLNVLIEKVANSLLFGFKVDKRRLEDIINGLLNP